MNIDLESFMSRSEVVFLAEGPKIVLCNTFLSGVFAGFCTSVFVKKEKLLQTETCTQTES